MIECAHHSDKHLVAPNQDGADGAVFREQPPKLRERFGVAKRSVANKGIVERESTLSKRLAKSQPSFMPWLQVVGAGNHCNAPVTEVQEMSWSPAGQRRDC